MIQDHPTAFMNKKVAYIYYFVIILIMAIWDGIGVEVPMIVRLGFLALTFVPLFKWVEMLPAVFVATLTISFNAFTSPLLPTSRYFYVIILLAFTFVSGGKKLVLPPGIFILCLLMVALTDLFQQGEFSYVSNKVLMVLLLYIIIKGNKERSREHMSYAFMMIANVLSYWTLLRPEAQMQSVHAIEGFEDVASWTDPNYLGCMIALGGTVAINEMLNNREKRLKTCLCVVTIVASVFSLAYLASRGAIVALAGGLIVMIVFSNKTKKSYKFLFVILAAAFLTFMYQSSYFDFVIARFQSDTMATGTDRTVIWTAKLNAFFTECRPIDWLIGLSHDRGLELGHFGRARAFHNDFVAALVEYGIVGLSLFIYTLYRVVERAPKEYKNTVWGLMTAYVAVCMTLEPTFSDMPSSIVFMCFIFYMLLFTKNRRESR